MLFQTLNTKIIYRKIKLIFGLEIVLNIESVLLFTVLTQVVQVGTKNPLKRFIWVSELLFQASRLSVLHVVSIDHTSLDFLCPWFQVPHQTPATAKMSHRSQES